jgi:outer membrane lipopolysaccharide assembly protein LptE/RlpB
VRMFFWHLFLIVCLILTGCGYHLSATSGLPPAVAGKNLAFPIFTNKSYRANVGATLTESLVDEFARRSGGKVMSEESADLVLNGTVLTYATSPVSYSADDKVREYRAVITVESTLIERTTRTVIWKGVLSWGQDYPANTDVGLQQNSEEAAIQEICRKVAQQVYQKISEGF